MGDRQVFRVLVTCRYAVIRGYFRRLQGCLFPNSTSAVTAVISHWTLRNHISDFNA